MEYKPQLFKSCGFNHSRKMQCEAHLDKLEPVCRNKIVKK